MELGIIKDVKEINTVIRSLKNILSLNYPFQWEGGDFKIEPSDSTHI